MNVIKSVVVDRIFKNESPKSIFEVGCAGGLLFAEYYTQHPGLIVGGIDNREYNLVAPKHYPECADNFILADATKTPWKIKDKQYDIVFTVGILLSIPDPREIITEMMRIGKIVYLAEFQDDNASMLGIAEETDNIYTYRIYRDYRKLLKKLGIKFEIVDLVAGKTIIKCQE